MLPWYYEHIFVVTLALLDHNVNGRQTIECLRTQGGARLPGFSHSPPPFIWSNVGTKGSIAHSSEEGLTGPCEGHEAPDVGWFHRGRRKQRKIGWEIKIWIPFYPPMFHCHYSISSGNKTCLELGNPFGPELHFQVWLDRIFRGEGRAEKECCHHRRLGERLPSLDSFAHC